MTSIDLTIMALIIFCGVLIGALGYLCIHCWREDRALQKQVRAYWQDEEPQTGDNNKCDGESHGPMEEE